MWILVVIFLIWVAHLKERGNLEGVIIWGFKDLVDLSVVLEEWRRLLEFGELLLRVVFWAFDGFDFVFFVGYWFYFGDWRLGGDYRVFNPQIIF